MFLSLLFFPIMIFFCWSVYSALKRLPISHLEFPAWFAWMMLIPFVGYVFLWIMLPFGIPRSFEKLIDEKDPVAKRSVEKLFAYGLAWVILQFFWLIPFCFIGLIVVIILYWLELNHFKREYLLINKNDKLLS